jgi:hypothetical protein
MMGDDPLTIIEQETMDIPGVGHPGSRCLQSLTDFTEINWYSSAEPVSYDRESGLTTYRHQLR